jgi:hypothetical protein
MAQIKKLSVEEAKEAAKVADDAYREQSQSIKKQIREANSKIISADRARAKARKDLRLAQKAEKDEQDRQQIEKGGA